MAYPGTAAELAASRDADPVSLRAILRAWRAELAPFPNRWRRAARVAFVTALGAGVMAAMQISNPLGLTLLLTFAAPEYAFTLTNAITFLIATAAMQLVMLNVIGALVNLPVLHLSVFIAYAFATTYLIYGVPRFGRLWLWMQIPTVTSFYLVIFDYRGLGWNDAQVFGGIAIALAMLWLFNNVVWPAPATEVLAGSVRGGLERSRHRLQLLIRIFLAEDGALPDHDLGVAAKLGYHLTLLDPATRDAVDIREAAALEAKVIVAERIDNEIDRLCAPACTQLGPVLEESAKATLRAAVSELDAALAAYIDGRGRPVQLSTRLDAARATKVAGRGGIELAELAERLSNIAALLQEDSEELPHVASGRRHPLPQPALHLNKFLLRFCARHTIAMTIAFVAGLFDNSAALHAALWLLMIGGPPSHGATAKKFTTRAIGAAGALSFAALATIIIAPNFVSPPAYMLAIFTGVLLMTYLGEGGGALSYLAIGSTAFVIAFSAPGPRPDMFGSIWTIWGISFGMIIRALVSVEWREHPNRTLAEEFERPLAALVHLTATREPIDALPVELAEMQIILGVEEMLNVAADAQLAGPSSGIDARNLVDALDTTRRLGFALGNLSLETSNAVRGFDDALRRHFEAWLSNLRAQLEPGQLNDAPLRTMVSSTVPFTRSSEDPRRAHIARLTTSLTEQLKVVRLN